MLKFLSIRLTFVLLSIRLALATDGDKISATPNFNFPRWEPRTIDCSGSGQGCTTEISGRTVECRTEGIGNETRSACPLNCPTASRLSVVTKRNYVDYHACAAYYTYGKEKRSDDWYMWTKPKCRAQLTTFCQFNQPSSEQNLNRT